MEDDYYEESPQYSDYIDDYEEIENNQRKYIMSCNKCDNILYTFNGNKDLTINCPYLKNGKCDP